MNVPTKPIVVSVSISAYNHAKFIAQTLDSILAQETNFAYEIIVGDDGSKDNTAQILREYQARFPDQIRLLLHEKNLGGGGKLNALSTDAIAEGKYICPVDGDDYWTSPHKLQKQVDFLETHPDCSMCFHNAQIVWEDGSHPSSLLNGPDQKEISTVDDLIGETEIWFIATSSIMFRKGLFETYPDWFFRSKSGDIPRTVLWAKHGNIGYLPEVMSVYRKNQGGLSFTDHESDAEFLLNRIGMYEDINRELDYKYDHRVKRNIARYYRKLLDSRQYRDHYAKRAIFALKYLWWGKPDYAAKKDVVWTYLLPQPVKKLYSAIRLLPYRLSRHSD
jgi:glycosyltransferase involved in cell wall biosynthesis